MRNQDRLTFLILLDLVIVMSLIPPSMCADTRDAGNSDKPHVKNIILMISDGCGYNHVDAAAVYQHGRPGAQVYHSFSVRMGMSTYEAGQCYDVEMAWKYFNCVKLESTDSAAAATAMACGMKTYAGAIGVDIDGHPIRNVVECAEEIGKATGVITSVQLSHATPAGFVAHNRSRGDYAGIGKEMISESALDVIMGCGHPLYDNNGEPLAGESLPNYSYVGGADTWRELLEGRAGGDADGDGTPDPWKLIQTREEFEKLAEGDTPARVLGVPEVAGTLQQCRDSNVDAEPFEEPFIDTVPTLEVMTRAALNVLDEDPDGFFLMIEGGAVDWASHVNQSGRMIEEEIDFCNAAKAVVEWVEANSNWAETLVIVTGDHETGYLTGPDSGVKEEGPVWNPLVNKGRGRIPGMQWNSGGHTNSLIPFYANGPQDVLSLFLSRANGFDPIRGAYLDNTSIASVIFYLWQ